MTEDIEITIAQDKLIVDLIERCIPLEKRWLNIPEIRKGVIFYLQRIPENLAGDELVDLCCEVAQDIDRVLCCGLREEAIYDSGGSFNEKYWDRVNKIENMLLECYDLDMS